MQMNSNYKKFEALSTLKSSWTLYTENFGGVFLVSLIPIGVWLFFQILSFFTSGSNTLLNSASNPEVLIKMLIKQITIGMMIYIFSFIINILVNAGIINYFVNLVKEKKAPSPSTLLVFDMRILNFIIFNILYIILSIVVTVITIIPFGIFALFSGINKNQLPIILSLSGILILLLIMIFIAISVMFALSKYLIIDKHENAIHAFLKSFSFMRKNFLEMLLLLILLSIITIGVAISTLFIGLLFSTPFCYVVMANAYKMIAYPELESAQNDDSQIEQIISSQEESEKDD